MIGGETAAKFEHVVDHLDQCLRRDLSLCVSVRRILGFAIKSGNIRQVNVMQRGSVTCATGRQVEV
jgi:hypothetical protein